MKAEQMFENLGWEKFEASAFIEYRKGWAIMFNLIEKEVNAYTQNNALLPEEVRAIYQQMEELGWLEND